MKPTYWNQTLTFQSGKKIGRALPVISRSPDEYNVSVQSEAPRQEWHFLSIDVGYWAASELPEFMTMLDPNQEVPPAAATSPAESKYGYTVLEFISTELSPNYYQSVGALGRNDMNEFAEQRFIADLTTHLQKMKIVSELQFMPRLFIFVKTQFDKLAPGSVFTGLDEEKQRNQFLLNVMKDGLTGTSDLEKSRIKVSSLLPKKWNEATELQRLNVQLRSTLLDGTTISMTHQVAMFDPTTYLLKVMYSDNADLASFQIVSDDPFSQFSRSYQSSFSPKPTSRVPFAVKFHAELYGNEELQAAEPSPTALAASSPDSEFKGDLYVHEKNNTSYTDKQVKGDSTGYYMDPNQQYQVKLTKTREGREEQKLSTEEELDRMMARRNLVQFVMYWFVSIVVFGVLLLYCAQRPDFKTFFMPKYPFFGTQYSMSQMLGIFMALAGFLLLVVGLAAELQGANAINIAFSGVLVVVFGVALGFATFFVKSNLDSTKNHENLDRLWDKTPHEIRQDRERLRREERNPYGQQQQQPSSVPSSSLGNTTAENPSSSLESSATSSSEQDKEKEVRYPYENQRLMKQALEDKMLSPTTQLTIAENFMDRQSRKAPDFANNLLNNIQKGKIIPFYVQPDSSIKQVQLKSMNGKGEKKVQCRVLMTVEEAAVIYVPQWVVDEGYQGATEVQEEVVLNLKPTNPEEAEYPIMVVNRRDLSDWGFLTRLEGLVSKLEASKFAESPVVIDPKSTNVEKVGILLDELERNMANNIRMQQEFTQDSETETTEEDVLSTMKMLEEQTRPTTFDDTASRCFMHLLHWSCSPDTAISVDTEIRSRDAFEKEVYEFERSKAMMTDSSPITTDWIRSNLQRKKSSRTDYSDPAEDEDRFVLLGGKRRRGGMLSFNLEDDNDGEHLFNYTNILDGHEDDSAHGWGRNGQEEDEEEKEDGEEQLEDLHRLSFLPRGEREKYSLQAPTEELLRRQERVGLTEDFPRRTSDADDQFLRQGEEAMDVSGDEEMSVTRLEFSDDAAKQLMNRFCLMTDDITQSTQELHSWKSIVHAVDEFHKSLIVQEQEEQVLRLDENENKDQLRAQQQGLLDLEHEEAYMMDLNIDAAENKGKAVDVNSARQETHHELFRFLVDIFGKLSFAQQSHENIVTLNLAFYSLIAINLFIPLADIDEMNSAEDASALIHLRSKLESITTIMYPTAKLFWLLVPPNEDFEETVVRSMKKVEATTFPDQHEGISKVCNEILPNETYPLETPLPTLPMTARIKARIEMAKTKASSSSSKPKEEKATAAVAAETKSNKSSASPFEQAMEDAMENIQRTHSSTKPGAMLGLWSTFGKHSLETDSLIVEKASSVLNETLDPKTYSSLYENKHLSPDTLNIIRKYQQLRLEQAQKVNAKVSKFANYISGKKAEERKDLFFLDDEVAFRGRNTLNQRIFQTAINSLTTRTWLTEEEMASKQFVEASADEKLQFERDRQRAVLLHVCKVISLCMETILYASHHKLLIESNMEVLNEEQSNPFESAEIVYWFYRPLQITLQSILCQQVKMVYKETFESKALQVLDISNKAKHVFTRIHELDRTPNWMKSIYQKAEIYTKKGTIRKDGPQISPVLFYLNHLQSVGLLSVRLSDIQLSQLKEKFNDANILRTWGKDFLVLPCPDDKEPRCVTFQIRVPIMLHQLSEMTSANSLSPKKPWTMFDLSEQDLQEQLAQFFVISFQHHPVMRTGLTSIPLGKTKTDFLYELPSKVLTSTEELLTIVKPWFLFDKVKTLVNASPLYKNDGFLMMILSNAFYVLIMQKAGSLRQFQGINFLFSFLFVEWFLYTNAASMDKIDLYTKFNVKSGFSSFHTILLNARGNLKDLLLQEEKDNAWSWLLQEDNDPYKMFITTKNAPSLDVGITVISYSRVMKLADVIVRILCDTNIHAAQPSESSAVIQEILSRYFSKNIPLLHAYYTNIHQDIGLLVTLLSYSNAFETDRGSFMRFGVTNSLVQNVVVHHLSEKHTINAAVVPPDLQSFGLDLRDDSIIYFFDKQSTSNEGNLGKIQAKHYQLPLCFIMNIGNKTQFISESDSRSDMMQTQVQRLENSALLKDINALPLLYHERVELLRIFVRAISYLSKKPSVLHFEPSVFMDFARCFIAIITVSVCLDNPYFARHYQKSSSPEPYKGIHYFMDKLVPFAHMVSLTAIQVLGKESSYESFAKQSSPLYSLATSKLRSSVETIQQESLSLLKTIRTLEKLVDRSKQVSNTGRDNQSTEGIQKLNQTLIFLRTKLKALLKKQQTFEKLAETYRQYAIHEQQQVRYYMCALGVAMNAFTMNETDFEKTKNVIASTKHRTYERAFYVQCFFYFMYAFSDLQYENGEWIRMHMNHLTEEKAGGDGSRNLLSPNSQMHSQLHTTLFTFFPLLYMTIGQDVVKLRLDLFSSSFLQSLLTLSKYLQNENFHLAADSREQNLIDYLTNMITKFPILKQTLKDELLQILTKLFSFISPPVESMLNVLTEEKKKNTSDHDQVVNELNKTILAYSEKEHSKHYVAERGVRNLGTKHIDFTRNAINFVLSSVSYMAHRVYNASTGGIYSKTNNTRGGAKENMGTISSSLQPLQESALEDNQSGNIIEKAILKQEPFYGHFANKKNAAAARAAEEENDDDDDLTENIPTETRLKNLILRQGTNLQSQLKLYRNHVQKQLEKYEWDPIMRQTISNSLFMKEDYLLDHVFTSFRSIEYNVRDFSSTIFKSTFLTSAYRVQPDQYAKEPEIVTLRIEKRFLNRYEYRQEAFLNPDPQFEHIARNASYFMKERPWIFSEIIQKLSMFPYLSQKKALGFMFGVLDTPAYVVNKRNELPTIGDHLTHEVYCQMFTDPKYAMFRWTLHQYVMCYLTIFWLNHASGNNSLFNHPVIFDCMMRAFSFVIFPLSSLLASPSKQADIYGKYAQSFEEKYIQYLKYHMSPMQYKVLYKKVESYNTLISLKKTLSQVVGKSFEEDASSLNDRPTDEVEDLQERELETAPQMLESLGAISTVLYALLWTVPPHTTFWKRFQLVSEKKEEADWDEDLANVEYLSEFSPQFEQLLNTLETNSLIKNGAVGIWEIMGNYPSSTTATTTSNVLIARYLLQTCLTAMKKSSKEYLSSLNIKAYESLLFACKEMVEISLLGFQMKKQVVATSIVFSSLLCKLNIGTTFLEQYFQTNIPEWNTILPLYLKKDFQDSWLEKTKKLFEKVKADDTIKMTKKEFIDAISKSGSTDSWMDIESILGPIIGQRVFQSMGNYSSSFLQDMSVWWWFDAEEEEKTGIQLKQLQHFLSYLFQKDLSPKLEKHSNSTEFLFVDTYFDKIHGITFKDSLKEWKKQVDEYMFTKPVVNQFACTDTSLEKVHWCVSQQRRGEMALFKNEDCVVYSFVPRNYQLADQLETVESMSDIAMIYKQNEALKRKAKKDDEPQTVVAMMLEDCMRALSWRQFLYLRFEILFQGRRDLLDEIDCTAFIRLQKSSTPIALHVLKRHGCFVDLSLTEDYYSLQKNNDVEEEDEDFHNLERLASFSLPIDSEDADDDDDDDSMPGLLIGEDNSKDDDDDGSMPAFLPGEDNSVDDDFDFGNIYGVDDDLEKTGMSTNPITRGPSTIIQDEDVGNSSEEDISTRTMDDTVRGTSEVSSRKSILSNPMFSRGISALPLRGTRKSKKGGTKNIQELLRKALIELDASENKATLSQQTINQIHALVPSFDDKINPSDLLNTDSIDIVIPPWGMSVATHSKRRLVWYNLFISIQHCASRDLRIQLFDLLHALITENQKEKTSSRVVSSTSYSRYNNRPLTETVKEFVKSAAEAGKDLFTSIYKLFTSKEETTFNDEKTVALTDFPTQFQEMMLKLLDFMNKETTIQEQIDKYNERMQPSEIDYILPESSLSSFSRWVLRQKNQVQKAKVVSKDSIVPYFAISQKSDPSLAVELPSVSLRFDSSTFMAILETDSKMNHQFEVEVSRWFYVASGIFWLHGEFVFGHSFRIEPTRLIEERNFTDDFLEISFKDLLAKLKREEVLRNEEKARKDAFERAKNRVVITKPETHVVKPYEGIKSLKSTPTVHKINLTLQNDAKNLLYYKHLQMRLHFYENYTSDSFKTEMKPMDYINVGNQKAELQVLFSFHNEKFIETEKKEFTKYQNTRKKEEENKQTKVLDVPLAFMEGGTSEFTIYTKSDDIDEASRNSTKISNIENYKTLILKLMQNHTWLNMHHYFVMQYEVLLDSYLVRFKFAKNLLYIDIDRSNIKNSTVTFGQIIRNGFENANKYVYDNPFLWLMCFETYELRKNPKFITLYKFSAEEMIETPVKDLILKTLLYLYYTHNADKEQTIDWTTIPTDLYMFVREYLPLCMTYIAISEYCGIYGSAKGNYVIVDFILSFISNELFQGRYILQPEMVTEEYKNEKGNLLDANRNETERIMRCFDQMNFSAHK